MLADRLRCCGFALMNWPFGKRYSRSLDYLGPAIMTVMMMMMMADTRSWSGGRWTRIHSSIGHEHRWVRWNGLRFGLSMYESVAVWFRFNNDTHTEVLQFGTVRVIAIKSGILIRIYEMY